MYYQILGFVGLALGSVASGSLVTALERENSTHESYRFIFASYGAIALVKIVLSLAMTPYAELNHPPFPVRGGAGAHDESDDETLTGTPTEQSPLLAVPGRPLVGRTSSTTPHVVDPSTKLDMPHASTQSASSLPLVRLLLVVALFSVDSFASSLTPASYVSLYFKSIYHASISTISTVLAGSALGAVFTSLLAGALSKRIGLVLTMVSAHGAPLSLSLPCCACATRGPCTDPDFLSQFRRRSSRALWPLRRRCRPSSGSTSLARASRRWTRASGCVCSKPAIALEPGLTPPPSLAGCAPLCDGRQAVSHSPSRRRRRLPYARRGAGPVRHRPPHQHRQVQVGLRHQRRHQDRLRPRPAPLAPSRQAAALRRHEAGSRARTVVPSPPPRPSPSPLSPLGRPLLPYSFPSMYMPTSSTLLLFIWPCSGTFAVFERLARACASASREQAGAAGSRGSVGQARAIASKALGPINERTAALASRWEDSGSQQMRLVVEEEHVATPPPGETRPPRVYLKKLQHWTAPVRYAARGKHESLRRRTWSACSSPHLLTRLYQQARMSRVTERNKPDDEDASQLKFPSGASPSLSSSSSPRRALAPFSRSHS